MVQRAEAAKPDIVLADWMGMARGVGGIGRYPETADHEEQKRGCVEWFHKDLHEGGETQRNTEHMNDVLLIAHCGRRRTLRRT